MNPNAESSHPIPVAADPEIISIREQLQEQRAEAAYLKTQMADMAGSITTLTEMLAKVVKSQNPVLNNKEGNQNVANLTPEIARASPAHVAQASTIFADAIPTPMAPVTVTPMPAIHVQAAPVPIINSNIPVHHTPPAPFAHEKCHLPAPNCHRGYAYEVPGGEPDLNLAQSGQVESQWSLREEMDKLLNEKLKNLSGLTHLEEWDIDNFIHLPEFEVPKEFKVPDFVKYDGNTNPLHHLRSYLLKMRIYSKDDNFLMTYFHESLTGAAYNWYMELDLMTIKTWRDLAQAFMRHFDYNNNNAPNRETVRVMRMKPHESFRTYAQRWRQMAREVQPRMTEKEMVEYFVRTLGEPFYRLMIAIPMRELSEAIEIGERLDIENREGRLNQISQGNKRFGANNSTNFKKNEGEVNFVSSNTFNNQSYSGPNNRPSWDTRPRFQPDDRPLPKFNVTNLQLYQELLKKSIMGPKPTKPLTPPFPKWYRPELRCEYHMGVVGHSIDNCDTFRRHVWSLLDNKVISIDEGGSNIQNNPLPEHDKGKQVALIEEDEILVKGAQNLKCSRSQVYQYLAMAGYYPEIQEMMVPTFCHYHQAKDHSIEDCLAWETELNRMMTFGVLSLTRKNLINKGCMMIGDDQERVMIRINGWPNVMSNSLPVIEESTVGYRINYKNEEPEMSYIVNSGLSLSIETEPMAVVHIPAPFPYESNKAVPWRYDLRIEKKDDQPEAIANITETGGVTRSGRVYAKEVPLPVVQSKTQKVVEDSVGLEEESEEEFLKVMKQSNYSIVDQLKKTPSKISLYSLIMSSEVHRKALQKMLNEAYVQPNITPEKAVNLVDAIRYSTSITFDKNEVSPNMLERPKALHITVKCYGNIIASVLIDGGSSLNVLPLSTLKQLPVDLSNLNHSNTVVRAFDGTRREVIGDIILPLQIGPSTFNVGFQVMDVDGAYTMLLGRPWIHAAHAVPSTLHQKLKYIEKGQVITIEAEEHLMISKPNIVPYIESAEEALESSFQCLEIEKNPIAASNSKVNPIASVNINQVAAHIMAKQGYQPGKGLGPNLQGTPHCIALPENIKKKGLGYVETLEDHKVIQAKAGKSKMTNEWIPHIRDTFPVVAEVINLGNTVKNNNYATVSCIRKAEPGEELANWEAEPVLVVSSE